MTECPNCGALNAGPGFNCANCRHLLGPERTGRALTLYERRHFYFILGVICAFLIFPIALYIGYLFSRDLWWDTTCRRYGILLIWSTVLLLVAAITTCFL